MSLIKSILARMAAIFFAAILFASCATLSSTGVGRIKRYEVMSERLPQEFDGCQIAFISDIHYPSKFTRKRLAKVVRKLRDLRPQMLLLGGDYVTADDYIDELFDSLATVKSDYGIYAVLGNHEFSRRSAIEKAMSRRGIILLKDEARPLTSDSAVYIAGVANPFKVDSTTVSPSAAVADSAYTILLVHTPDYAQMVDAPADIVLSGHTHGGQVSLFGLYTPVKNTRYGTRFLRGMNSTDRGVSVVTTNGIGTSRRKIRFCVPSEIVVVTLRRAE